MLIVAASAATRTGGAYLSVFIALITTCIGLGCIV